MSLFADAYDELVCVHDKDGYIHVYLPNDAKEVHAQLSASTSPILASLAKRNILSDDPAERATYCRERFSASDALGFFKSSDGMIRAADADAVLMEQIYVRMPTTMEMMHALQNETESATLASINYPWGSTRQE